MAPGVGHEDVDVPYGGDYEPTDPSPNVSDASTEKTVGYAQGFRRALATHVAVYMVGLAAWAGRSDLAWPVVVYWFVALLAGLGAGLAMCLARSMRRVGGGVVAGTLVAFALELVTTAVVWGIWLSAHPGWQLS